MLTVWAGCSWWRCRFLHHRSTLCAWWEMHLASEAATRGGRSGCHWRHYESQTRCNDSINGARIIYTLQWQHVIDTSSNHLRIAVTYWQHVTGTRIICTLQWHIDSMSLVQESFEHCNDSMSLVLVLIICALQWHTDSMSLVPESFAHCNDSVTGTSSNHLHIAMTVSLMPELFTDTMQGHHISGTRMIQTHCNDSVTV